MANGTTKNVYTDVFGGGPKFKIPSFSSKVEDYTDIFSSYHSGASSIPVLDLPVVGDDEIVDAQSLKFDYKEIFGGFDDDDDYAVPYQELFFDTKAEEESDSDEDVWTPAETGSPSGESSEDPVCLESNQPFSTVESPYAFDGVKQFNVSYHKTNQRSNDDRISGFTHIAQLNAVPAYTFLVDGDLTLQMAECNGQLPDVANSHSLNVNANDGAKDGERLWDATTAQPACADVLRTSESDQKLQINPDGNGTYHEKAFVTVTDVSLRTQPSEVPPPARPPPKFTIKQGCSKSMASDLKPSKNYARHGVAIDRSPPFFDVEVDASLSAAASAAAMKEAMDKAQARLKSAKELMEKRKDGPQYRKNLWLNEGSKGKERREGGIAHDAYRVNEENSHENFGKTVDSKGFDREERHKAVQGAQVESDVDMKERFLSVSKEAIDKSHVECRLTQGSKKQEEVIGEWKAEEQFYELVKQDTPGKVLVASKQKISEKNSMPTRVYEREQNERNAAEVVEFNNREEHEKKLKECIEREENEKQKKEALQREEKERRQRETYEREEKEKKQKALEREEKERRLREVREREEIERKQKALELEANERRQKEACEREENEKKQKALEREENERRQREAHEREENEKKQQAFEREENERRQREVLAREARVREQNEKRIYEKKLNEIKQREENERRQKQAHEREENENRINEKKQKEAHQREETQRRQKEALYIEENEKRLEEAREREEKERKLNEAAEENDGKLKDAHEQEENVKVPNVSHEQDKGEKRLKNPCEQEVTEKVLPNGKCETLGDEKKLRKPQKQKETEMNEVSHRWERNEMKLKKASELEDIGNGHIEACEREEKDNEVSQDFHLCSNEEKNLKPETVVQENVEYVTKLKAANNAPMQVEVENSKVTCDGCEQEENNVKLERAQESCTEKEYGKTVNTVQHASEHRENGNVLKVVELSCEQEANEQLRGACLAEDSPEYDDCENNKMAVPNPKLDGTEKKTGTLEETVTEEKDKRCSTENLVSLDCKERKKSIKEASGEGPCVENGMNAKVIQPIGEEYKTIKSKKADQDIERKETKLNGTAGKEEREKEGRLLKEREQEKERLRKLEEDIQREREKDRMAVERATREARERAYIEARERAERAAVERATAEARQRAMAEARERLEKACAEAREKSLAEKASTESRLREERTAVERATAEARERAAEKAAMEARERIERSVSEKFSTTSRDSGLRHSASFSDMRDAQFQGSSSFSTSQRYSSSTPHGASATEKSQANEVESAQRCKARLERHQRTVERAAKALAEKNMRDYLAQREQTERNRLAETLDADVKRWSSGKQGNLRALLSTLQYILGPESGWQPVPLTDVITAAAAKKAYRKATLCVHPDKLQQRGATIQQKYVCEKVFDLLKEAWNKFNSEER